MSFDAIKRADHTKGNKEDHTKLGYGPNGETKTYKIRVTEMRGKEEPEPPVMPWVAIDFVVIESDNDEQPEGTEAGHAWTVGGEWGHLGFQDLKAFLAMALDLDTVKAREIDRSVVLFCTGDDQPVAGAEFIATVSRQVRGPKSKKAGEPFAKVHFKKAS